MKGSSRVYLLVGPVGAGKSTLAQCLAQEHGAVRLTLDDWMTTLFRADRPQDGVIAWYVERAKRCVDQIWRVTQDLVATDTSVILEIGLLQRHQREDLYARARAADIEVVIVVVEAPRDIRRERVLQRNRDQGSTFSVVVPLEFFERASDMWEAPCDDECRGRDVRWVAG